MKLGRKYLWRTKKKAKGGLLPEYISNSDLRIEDIPLKGAPWHEIALFSLTFDGYSRAGSFNRCTPVPDVMQCRTLSEMRARLFFEHRRWILKKKQPCRETMEYLYDLLEKMRDKLARDERA
ncbi:MAG: hypothetical protein BWZ01_02870 [Deltaproteobacteria bacterium ADurb.BinA179]|jgi:hypothetical protein|nr:hypothetical protein [Deltaproteobacteria bacterium]MDI9542176.1 hypothetical protein [Pseudomonadota bacterium]OPZ24413.1 MAG: hypothetical protein BWZ01_02870 [Deltaproteobacteria bacterium ADurb.BinA179]HOD70501.1 hypothetical protein [Deltaproteobacteria bacterium]HPV30632.1 hypothetical protein [Deltaproteobacteria bacterium]